MPNDYDQRIEELEGKIKKLEEHQHLGDDGSRLFSGETLFAGKELELHGAGTMKQDFTTLPLKIYDAAQGVEKKRRASALGVGIAGEKESVNEAITATLSSAKVVDPALYDVKPSNRIDFRDIMFSQFQVYNFPQAKQSYLVAFSSPAIQASGSMTNGGNTLTDSLADFVPNQLVGGRILVNGENKLVISNTKNVITISGVWGSSTGSYNYLLYFKTEVGTPVIPMGDAYFGGTISIGYSGQKIFNGSGSPEGAVSANAGSLYLNRDGGANTTLYIKESGAGNTGWIAK